MPATLNEISKAIVNLCSQLKDAERKVEEISETHAKAEDEAEAAEIQKKMDACTTTLEDLKKQLAAQKQKIEDTFADAEKDDEYKEEVITNAGEVVCDDNL